MSNPQMARQFCVTVAFQSQAACWSVAVALQLMWVLSIAPKAFGKRGRTWDSSGSQVGQDCGHVAGGHCQCRRAVTKSTQAL